MKFTLTILVLLLLASIHLVIESDPENGQEVGTPVSKDRVIDAFEQDVQTVLSDCAILYPDFDELPERSSASDCEHDVQYGKTSFE